jgi:hypothetical protein
VSLAGPCLGRGPRCSAGRRATPPSTCIRVAGACVPCSLPSLQAHAQHQDLDASREPTAARWTGRSAGRLSARTVWDSVNRRVLWPITIDSCSKILQMLVYHPAADTWQYPRAGRPCNRWWGRRWSSGPTPALPGMRVQGCPAAAERASIGARRDPGSNCLWCSRRVPEKWAARELAAVRGQSDRHHSVGGIVAAWDEELAVKANVQTSVKFPADTRRRVRSRTRS